MDKLYLDFDENGLLTMYIEGNLDKFKSTLKFNNNKYIFGVEKRLIKDKNLIDKLKYEHVSLIPKVDTINTKNNKKTEPTNEEKYEVHDLPDDIIFDGKNFYSLVPLEWRDNGKGFTCINTAYTRSTVMSLLKKRFFDISVMNDYLNDTILPEIFDVKDVDRIDSYEAIYKIFNETLERIELPNYIRKIDIGYKNGKIVLEKPKTLIKINVPEEIRIIKCSSDDLKFRDHILYNIFIPKTVKYIEEFLVNYVGKINLLAFDKNFDGVIRKRSLISFSEINSLKSTINTNVNNLNTSINEVSNKVNILENKPIFKKFAYGLTDTVYSQKYGYNDHTINFTTTFDTPPFVMICPLSGSTEAKFGNLCFTVLNVSTTNMTIRIFNNSDTGRNPRVYWLAFEM